MSTNRKPRKAYRPKHVALNNLAIAAHHAGKPPASDRAEVIKGVLSALEALRQGVATERQWSVAAGAVMVALAIERQGIVRGLKGHLETTQDYLQKIYNRALDKGGGQWARVTLYYQEIDSIHNFVELHKFQMDQLSRAEFLAAIDAAEKDILKQGCTPIIVRDIERMVA